jgi:hypothetical protein
MRCPVFPGHRCGGIREIGQLQHLDPLGELVHLLQPEGQNKRQARLVNIFLNTAVHADPGHLDPVLVGLHVNEKEVVAENHQHDHGDKDLQTAGHS